MKTLCLSRVSLIYSGLPANSLQLRDLTYTHKPGNIQVTLHRWCMLRNQTKGDLPDFFCCFTDRFLAPLLFVYFLRSLMIFCCYFFSSFSLCFALWFSSLAFRFSSFAFCFYSMALFVSLLAVSSSLSKSVLLQCRPQIYMLVSGAADRKRRNLPSYPGRLYEC